MKYTSIIISILALMVASCKIQTIEEPYKIIMLGDYSGDMTMKTFKKYYRVGLRSQILEREFEYDSIGKKFVYARSFPLKKTEIINFDTKNIHLRSEKTLIINGYPQSVYYAKACVNDTVKTYTYKKGNISGDYIVKNLRDSVLYKTRFKGGNGYWKDYYYKINKLREEGQVKNNYKYGAWKYYNKTGKLDSIKHYQLTDSVDVRYPYCLFNKKEPCYKKRSKKQNCI
ncbi:MAG: hypothetical protein CR968_00470 [Flavobacteriia bacterium]|nr:MAG: hypothetical protein CR968_00470 [Flavobacteriia bacterium]